MTARQLRPPIDKLLTQREAADRLRISVERLRHWRYEGKLEAIRFGHRSVRIRESEVERLVREASVPREETA